MDALKKKTYEKYVNTFSRNYFDSRDSKVYEHIRFVQVVIPKPKGIE